MEPIYGREALRRYREQHPAIETAPAPDAAAGVVLADDEDDDFDDLFDTWVDHNMEVFG